MKLTIHVIEDEAEKLLPFLQHLFPHQAAVAGAVLNEIGTVAGVVGTILPGNTTKEIQKDATNLAVLVNPPTG